MTRPAQIAEDAPTAPPPGGAVPAVATAGATLDAPAAAPAAPDASAETPPRRRGPGRNLPAAIAVGVGLGGLLLACLFLVPAAFPVLVGVALVLGTFEATRALATGGIRVPLIPLVVGAAGMAVSTATGGAQGLVVSTAVAICVVMIWRVVESGGVVALRDVAGGVFTLAWVPFLGCFTLLLFERGEHGAYLALLALLVPVANDVGGYAAGVLFGAHPMAPSISPKKSWEGFIGSVVSGTAAAVAVLVLALDAPWWTGLVLGPVLVVISTCGDLSESLLKRDLGIKDMGHLLPGHGGVLDRIDSMLLAAPITYIILELLLP